MIRRFVQIFFSILKLSICLDQFQFHETLSYFGRELQYTIMVCWCSYNCVLAHHTNPTLCIFSPQQMQGNAIGLTRPSLQAKLSHTVLYFSWANSAHKNISIPCAKSDCSYVSLYFRDSGTLQDRSYLLQAFAMCVIVKTLFKPRNHWTIGAKPHV